MNSQCQSASIEWGGEVVELNGCVCDGGAAGERKSHRCLVSSPKRLRARIDGNG